MRWLENGIQFDYRRIAGIDVGWQRFYSCNISVKRDMLEWTGGFDEQRFPFGYEDLELGRRMSDDHGFRLLYNADAIGEHLKTETLETWRRNLKRIATAERRFTELYPDERPYFYDSSARPPMLLRHGAARARLARFVAPQVPWLGRFVWRSFDLVCRNDSRPSSSPSGSAAESR